MRQWGRCVRVLTVKLLRTEEVAVALGSTLCTTGSKKGTRAFVTLTSCAAKCGVSKANSTTRNT